MKRELYRRIFVGLLSFFACFFAVSVITTFFLYPVSSQSDSMEPELYEKSVVLVSPLFKNPDRGQLMLVKTSIDEEYSFFNKSVDFVIRFFTAGKISPYSDKNGVKPCIRRVVGLPGDTVYISEYLVYVKPEGKTQFLTEFELTKVKYNLTVPKIATGIDKGLGAIGNMESIKLNSGEYFVLGDNRLEALDSRIWGAITQSSFEGRALCVYFPFVKARFF